MPNKFIFGPIDFRVKCAELRVTKDQPIATKVCDIESFSDFLISLGYEEIKVVGDAPSLVI